MEQNRDLISPQPGSQGKHESEVPVFSLSQTLENYFKSRVQALSKLDKKAPLLPVPERLPEIDSKLLRQLEKRFVLKSDIRLAMNPVIAALSNEAIDQLMIQVVARLLEEFEIQNDWNSLNTAIRMLDLLISKFQQTELVPSQLSMVLRREFSIMTTLNEF
ncbi:hypothetical protein [Rheinheimera faecalis]|jgi:hypothetical protein|uniref:hypothetical protein n=1 Tax=Rheinheimera faecalis TaxID=2901141 RepID=UPI001E3D264F|nr:hypothetical protein [Rheinheimera faecalis]